MKSYGNDKNDVILAAFIKHVSLEYHAIRT